MKRRAIFASALGAALCAAVGVGTALAQATATLSDPAEKPRVFVTDSQSWEVNGYSGGGPGGGASTSHGGARPQTAEIIKTFGQRCPQVVTNNIQQKVDYVVLLDHEGGKSFVSHKNKVAVFARVSGDSVMSKSTLSLGGSVQEACEAIEKDWAEKGKAMRAAAVAAADPPKPASPVVPAAAAADPAPAAPIVGKLAIASVPDGADIEVDGSFVGNAPSEVQVSEGEHTVSVKKTGFKDWERKLKVSGGSNVHLTAELQQSASQ
ncbi:MAG TPA: PEGA domain-containing protein [Candidatus Sulfotelmatobacter sp.]